MNALATPPSAKAATADIESKVRNEVRDIGIPPRPAILDRIRAETGKDEPDFNHLANLIGSDVGLSAGIIKVANAPYYGFSRKVRSAQDALLVLGLTVIVRTIAGIELQKGFPKISSLDRFWDASACTARASGWLVLQLSLPRGIRPDDAYTFGLFSIALPEASRYMIAPAQVTEHLIQIHTKPDKTQEWPKLGDACMKLLGLDEPAFAQLQKDSRAVVFGDS
jgi:HD-like signal output (HDOD) protein